MEFSIILSENRLISKILEFSVFLVVKFARTVIKLFRIPDKNIVVIAFHKIGDSVLTIPALRQMYKFYNHSFYIFCFEETVPIFEVYFPKDYIINFKHSDFAFNGRIARSIVRKRLNELNPGLIFDLTGGMSTASMLFQSNAQNIIGISDDYLKSIYTKHVPLRKRPHNIDIYLDAIKPLIPVSDDIEKVFNTEIKKEGYILIHPFAGWASKEWNFYKFIQLAEKLNKIYNLKLVSHLSGIKTAEINEFNSIDIEVKFTKDIYDLMILIKDSSLFISNDSGPLYIANMLGKPTFSIYGPTNPEFSLPFGNYHRYSQQKIKCSPSKDKQYCFTDAGRKGCPSYECMNSLDVDTVYNKIGLFIQELGIINRSQKLDYLGGTKE